MDALMAGGLLVEESFQKDHVFPMGLHRREAGADFHRGAITFCPPVDRLDTVREIDAGEADGRATIGVGGRSFARVGGPNRKRFKPWEGQCEAGPAEKGAAGHTGRGGIERPAPSNAISGRHGYSPPVWQSRQRRRWTLVFRGGGGTDGFGRYRRQGRRFYLHPTGRQSPYCARAVDRMPTRRDPASRPAI